MHEPSSSEQSLPEKSKKLIESSRELLAKLAALLKRNGDAATETPTSHEGDEEQRAD